MSGIVVITTIGAAKRDFTNALEKETNVVKLVVIQSVRRKPFFKRVLAFYKKVGTKGILQEIYYLLAVKLSKRKKDALSLVSSRSEVKRNHDGYLPETIKTDNVNEEAVYNRIKEIKPDLIVIWGGYILKPRLLTLARFTTNIHFGFVPYYRGTNGIQHAIVNGDFEHIGITIHYAVPEVDAGEIITIVRAVQKQSPKEFFTDLNDRAAKEYLEIAKKIWQYGRIASEPQDLSRGKNHLLKEWTYKKQNALAEKIIKWPKKFS